MKILHLSNTPLSNAPANIVQAQQSCGHESSLLLERQSNINKVFVGGDLWSKFHPEELEEKFVSADVIHFHNFAKEQLIFKRHPQLWEIAKKKKSVIQYHSPRHSTESFETTISDPMFKGRKLVLAQYHTRLYPECEHIVPNIIPINDTRYMPLKNAAAKGSPVSISFSPSNTHLRGWDYKGYDVIYPIFCDLQRKGFHTDIIKNVPHEECLDRKRWSHIGVEEIVTGSYHLSFLEYMSMGVATFANMDELTIQAIGKIVGEEGVKNFAHIQVDPVKLSTRVQSITAAGYVNEIGADCRKWMEKYWNPADHVKRYNSIYESL